MSEGTATVLKGLADDSKELESYSNYNIQFWRISFRGLL